MQTKFLKTGEAVLLDDEDAHLWEEFNWVRTNGHTYNGHNWHYVGVRVLRHSRVKCLLLHRLIMGCSFGDGRIIDHRNGNAFDCQKKNLRFSSHGQNISNQRSKTRSHKTSFYHGVHKYRGTSRWRAEIRAKGNRFYLGTFSSDEEAARAYDLAAHRLHGEFASLNFN